MKFHRWKTEFHEGLYSMEVTELVQKVYNILGWRAPLLSQSFMAFKSFIFCFRAQFGMDNEGNYRQQSLTNMQKAVYNGELSVVDYYERQVSF